MLLRVHGRSMTPTLQSGDWYWATKPGSLRRGDVVMVSKASRLVKRVVGLPGERVELDSGAVRINGVPLQESYVGSLAHLEPHASREWTLGPDAYCVLGDARDDSLDSRRFGPVSKSEITGVLVKRIWPWRRAAAAMAPLLVSATLAAAPSTPTADRTLTLAKENQLIMVIGHYVAGQGWAQATDRYITTYPGDTFTLMSVEGPLERVAVNDAYRSLPDSVPAGWTARIKRQTREPRVALALRGDWMNTEQAKVLVLPLEDAGAVQIVSDFLKTNGRDSQTPQLTQALRVSLGSDAGTATLVCARSPLAETVSISPTMVYAIALLRKDVNSAAKPTVLFSQLSLRPSRRSMEDHQKWHGVLDTVQVIGVLDVDGDGGLEVVLYRQIDGADQVNVWSVRDGPTRLVLDAVKPLYN